MNYSQSTSLTTGLMPHLQALLFDVLISSPILFPLPKSSAADGAASHKVSEFSPQPCHCLSLQNRVSESSEAGTHTRGPQVAGGGNFPWQCNFQGPD